jgi:SEC-C motif
MTAIGRNTPCPCGSGLKYKRCCLRHASDLVLDAAEAEHVWDRMQSWALMRWNDEFTAPLQEHMAARGIGSDERPALDDDLSLALCWLLIDRQLPDRSGTPAQAYAKRPELSPAERAMATRIATSGLGLHRVNAVEPGAWIELQNALTGSTTRVTSPRVSREAVRWHVLLCRVMEGGPMPSLWGAAAFYEPAEEGELLAELRRIADDHDLGTGTTALEAALRVGARELVCFVPASRAAAAVPYTLEGDPVAIAEASWRLRDASAAFDALHAAPELACDDDLEDGEGITFDWLTSRRALIARRPALPVGAICLERSPVLVGDDGALESQDVTSLGTFTLYEDRLEFFGQSEQRLSGAVSLVERRLGELIGPPETRMRSVDQALASARAKRDASPASHAQRSGTRQWESSAVPDARVREFTYRRWLDDPNERLGGISPRAAAARGEHREEIERQLRGFEHHSARERADGAPGPEVAWLRSELSLEAAGAAA